MQDGQKPQDTLNMDIREDEKWETDFVPPLSAVKAAPCWHVQTAAFPNNTPRPAPPLLIGSRSQDKGDIMQRTAGKADLFKNASKGMW